MEIIVADDQLSLAIGKRGQNVRLAARLTGWKLDIKSESKAAAAELLEFSTFDGTAPEEDADAETEPQTGIEPPVTAPDETEISGEAPPDEPESSGDALTAAERNDGE